jgi:hypothetical protein
MNYTQDTRINESQFHPALVIKLNEAQRQTFGVTRETTNPLHQNERNRK